LRDSTVVNNDMVQALTTLGEELAPHKDDHASAALRVVAEGKQRNLDPMLHDEIYRIAREALRNAFRHAQADSIEAELHTATLSFSCAYEIMGMALTQRFSIKVAVPDTGACPGCESGPRGLGGNWKSGVNTELGRKFELTIPASVAYGTYSPRPRFWFLRNKNYETHGHQS